MPYSMTAFARYESRSEQGELIWELRSVNHRYLETVFRLPEDLRRIESAAREKVGKYLSRGKVDCSLRYRPGSAVDSAIALNLAMAEKLLQASDDLVSRFDREMRPPTIMDLLQWPGVVEQSQPDITPVIEQALQLLEQALQQMLDNRQREGDRLAELIRQRCGAMREQVGMVNSRMPEVLRGLRQRLRDRLDEIAEEMDPARLEQEMVMLTQRLDVDEEMDRLLVHLAEVEGTIGRDEPIGRRLDFLMQELNREANTLGSKSNDVLVTQCSVEMKVLIEQMREQIQNIE